MKRSDDRTSWKKGGCHCGSVRFEVLLADEVEVQACNCSICRMTGYLHLIMPKSRFRLLAGQESLTTYAFKTRTAKHLFCRFCGIKSFYVPRSHPDGYSVNARCLDPSTVASVMVEACNGREWEKQHPEGRGRLPAE